VWWSRIAKNHSYTEPVLLLEQLFDAVHTALSNRHSTPSTHCIRQDLLESIQGLTDIHISA